MEERVKTREELIARMQELVSSRRMREMYMRRDDDGLRRAVARLERDRELVLRYGHIHSSGCGLRPVKPETAKPSTDRETD